MKAPKTRRNLPRPTAGRTSKAVVAAAELPLPLTPTDIEALRDLQDEGNDLLHDYRTIESALRGKEAHEYCESLGHTLMRATDRLQDLLDRLEDARGGQVIRDAAE